MAHYLFQAAYTPEALAALVKNPQNRFEVVAKAIEKLGGKIVSGWFCFGEYDIVCIYEMPDNVNAAAFSISVTAGGALKSGKTTPLFDANETLQIYRQAAKTGYRPPQ